MPGSALSQGHPGFVRVEGFSVDFIFNDGHELNNINFLFNLFSFSIFINFLPFTL